MARPAEPTKFRQWYVTEAGGKGKHKLCLVEEGIARARDELIDYLAKLKQEKRDGVVRSDAPYTVAQQAAEFLKMKEATKRANTFDFYQKNLQRLVKWFGGREARKVNLTHAADYVKRLQDDGLGNTTINHHLRAAKMVFKYATEADILSKNPWRSFPLLEERKRQRVVSAEEFAKLLKACDKCIAYKGKVTREENRQLMRDILHMLRFTAMRPGELRHLRWDHVHWDDNFIVIPAAEQKTGTTAKAPQDRLIPVLEEGMAILRARHERYGHIDRVFPNILGEEWSDAVFSRRFKRLRERAGLDDPDRNGEVLVPYSLRHTRLTEAGVTEGWSYPTLQRMAGHTPGSSVTARYVHPSKADLLREAKAGAERRQAARPK